MSKTENGNKTDSKQSPTEQQSPPSPVCGIVMPISSIDGCSESHWADVLAIITDGIKTADFQPNLVSNGEESGLIHARITQNLYHNEVVVCDVSEKNANVMFELGLRLAFDKPTIIVKDDKTSYSFDTGQIEHLEYPRELRFQRIVEFKQKLAAKIKATHERSTDPTYSTFLKYFGEFKIAKLEEKEISGQEFILRELQNIKSAIERFKLVDVPRTEFIEPSFPALLHSRQFCLRDERAEFDFDATISKIVSDPGIARVEKYRVGDHSHGVVFGVTNEALRRAISSLPPRIRRAGCSEMLKLNFKDSASSEDE